MSIEQLREAIPDYAKDLKINLGNVLSGSSLPPLETYGAALAARNKTPLRAWPKGTQVANSNKGIKRRKRSRASAA